MNSRYEKQVVADLFARTRKLGKKMKLVNEEEAIEAAVQAVREARHKQDQA